MKAENLSVLLRALAVAPKAAEVKPPSTPTPKTATTTPPDDDGAQWRRFKAECVLLKRRK